MGFIEPGLVTLLIVTGLTLTSAMTAALIFSLMPIIQPFTGRLILGEPVRPAVVIGAAIAIAGTAVFIAGQDAGTHSLLGDALVAAGMLCSCANQLLARRVAQRRGRPMAVSALQLTAAAGVGMCALLTIDRPDSVLGGGDRQNVVLTLVYLGVFASAVPFFLYNFSLRSLPVGPDQPVRLPACGAGIMPASVIRPEPGTSPAASFQRSSGIRVSCTRGSGSLSPT